LIVDEVLAVGDAEFQRKCLGKMQDVAGAHGRTVLFVSHSMAAISAICSRRLLVVASRLACAGTSAETITRYMSTLQSDGSSSAWEGPAPGGDEPVQALRARVVAK